MISHWLLLPPLAVGHFCLTVLAVNVFHGLGLDERRVMPRAKPMLLLTLGAASLGLLGMLTLDWSAWPWPLQGYALICLATALVALPADILARRRRRPPEQVSGRAEPVSLALPSERHFLIGDSKDAWWLRLPGNQALRPVRHDWEVLVQELPGPLDGLRLLHLSDLHLHRGYSRRFYEALADRAAEIETDLVLFTGDLMDDEQALEWASPILSRLRGRLGQFAVLGNHDARFDPSQPTAALVDAGFEVIEGAWVLRNVEDSKLVIGGTSHPWGPLPDPSAMPEGDLRILLSHSPDTFYRASAWGIDLVLCGHTHGGQYRLPIIGPVLLPSRYSRRFDTGFFQQDRTLMYVSRGLAGQHPLRLNCPPEFSQFVLRAMPTHPNLDRQADTQALTTGRA